ncbi:MAG: L-threonylcarbamoyladenylate synthase [Nitrososphaeria archaeon]|nr:L-threonylcarbamoyladenylate synthase [Nitrososphaeria archaeon]
MKILVECMHRVRETKVLVVDPSNLNLDHLREVAKVIREGGLVVFPTETVYGLGADAFNREAVKRVYEVKGRPADNPLIVHISNIGQLEHVAETDYLTNDIYKIIEKFWPGPLTLIIPKSRRIPYEVTAGLNVVAVRMPAHPVAINLIELCETPIVGPSANPAGKPSPTSGEHVKRDMMGKVDVIIDSGETLYGVESTIIDFTREFPVLLRPGAIPVEEVERHLQKKIVIPDSARGLIEASEALSPGMKYRHYAPDTPLIILESKDYSDLKSYSEKVLEYVKNLKRSGKKIIVLASRETRDYYGEIDILLLGSRKNLFEVARNLFSVLRIIDELDVDLAVAEGFEERGLGLTIMNRLRKASGYNIVKID